MELSIYLQENPAFFYTIVIIFSLVVGSFLNVVIYRMPVMMMQTWRRECCEFLEIEPEAGTPARFDLASPGSRCPECNHRITALENIPVISYLILGGRCSECHAPISLRYPVIELLSAVVAFMAAYHFGFTAQAFLAMLFGWALLVLGAIDLEHKLLPDDITLPFIWLGLLVNLFGVYTDIQSAIIGAVGGYLSLWSVYMLFKLITGKEGMGYGDFKLLAMLGAWMGWQMLPLVIILSSLVGAIVGISLILFLRHERSVPIPFGPYLAAAGWLALLYGDVLMREYYRWSFAAL